MNNRENILKAIRFESPEYIPMTFSINAACWQNYSQDFLFDLMESHKLLFPDFKRPEGKYSPDFALVARKDSPYTDDWGCLWETTENGITGTVTRHPLKSWTDLRHYKAPDPEVCTGIGPVNWRELEANFKKAREDGEITRGGLRHGHTFLQLCDIRGYENLMFDMADDEPGLRELAAMVEDFNMSIIRRYINMKADIIHYPEDLGMQTGPMLSPRHFREYIKPSYQRLMQPAREKGSIIHMHSDGHLHDLIDDIIDGGVQIINLQDLVNGIDWIAGRFAGKVCVELDIDRQFITTKGTPEQIDALIHEEVSKIGRKDGGLMMVFGLYPGTPPQNVKAIMDAMEKYALYYS